jgi:hypothetical protein
VLGSTIGLRETLWVAGIGSMVSFLWLYLSPVRTLQVIPTPVE